MINYTDSAPCACSGGGTAAGISYNNSASGLSATNLQDAIDELAVGTPGEYQVQTTYSNAWGGYPLTGAGSGFGACGGSISVPPFYGSISPGSLGEHDGLGVGFARDSDTGELYFILFVAGGSLGGAKYRIEAPGLSEPLSTELMTPESTSYGPAYIWGLDTGSVPAPWNSESSFTISIVPG